MAVKGKYSNHHFFGLDKSAFNFYELIHPLAALN